MAAEVSSLVRLMSGRDSNESSSAGKSTAPITRDLLGGCCTLDSKELDLDLQVPAGWEKRLDLKSGKVFLQRCNSTNSSSSTSENKATVGKTWASFQELNFSPSSKQGLSLFDDTSLDLKLVSSSSASPSSSNFQSVCTLDKVKSALERAEKETVMRKRSVSSMSKSSSSPPRSNSSCSVKDSDFDQEEKSPAISYAAGCPCCLLYVLVSTSNPKCPRCYRYVPFPVAAKKPRIDLNMSI